jgi:xylulokinase
VANPAIAGFADASGRYLPLVCTLNASKVTDTFAALLGVDHRGFDQLVAAAPPGSDGIVLLPYLDGERTPDLPVATGSLLGVRTTATRALVARACVEGVLCSLVEALDVLSASGVDTSGRLLLTGGAARGTSYGQVLADLTGRPIDVVAEEEMVARGAAVQAAAVLVGADPMTVAASWMPVASSPVEPDPRADAAGVRGAYTAARGLMTNGGDLRRDAFGW